MKDVLPAPDQLLQLEPEEVAVFVLRLLCQDESQWLHRGNFTSDEQIVDYVSDPNLWQQIGRQVAQILMEGWVWLEREGMIAPRPGITGEWVFVTRRGMRANEESNLAAYIKGNRLPEESLDPVLARKVRPLFLRGDYDVAVFQAFKEVEIRVRKAAGLPDSLVGVELVRQAFDPQRGPLADMTRIPAERKAMSHLFAGAIGLYKNPSSHRDMTLDDPDEATELILLANHLLRVVSRSAGEREPIALGASA